MLYYSEHRINENYSNLLLAFWSGLINWINFELKNRSLIPAGLRQ